MRFAKQGAKFVSGFDISFTAVHNAHHMSIHNNVKTHICQMDFHKLAYADNTFDLVYGMEILHHIDCEAVAKEIHRVLKPAGIGYFRENSDKNPILRFFRRLVFGKPGGYQKQKFLFFKRVGTTDEYPLTDDEIESMRKIFNGKVEEIFEVFLFFYVFNTLIFKSDKIGKLLWNFDQFLAKIFPFIKRYSFAQSVKMVK